MDECLIFLDPAGPRSREPVTCGIPWPAGRLNDVDSLAMFDADGDAVPLQARIQEAWPDGSIRWALLDWQATLSRPQSFRVVVDAGRSPTRPGPPQMVETRGDRICVETGVARFEMQAGDYFPFAATGGIAEGVRAALNVRDSRGRIHDVRVDRWEMLENGHLRSSVRGAARVLHDDVLLLELDAILHFFAGSAIIRFELTLRNPRAAGHPGNIWSLGEAGSIYLREASFRVQLPTTPGDRIAELSPEAGTPFETFGGGGELYQDSSGGDNWRSTNHVNREGVVRLSFSGYRFRAEGVEREGRRATPIVRLRRGGRTTSLVMEQFWQNFPKAIEIDGEGISLGLFPNQSDDVHEIQGGEQKTHVFFAGFGPDTVSEPAFDWCRRPLRPRAEPSWYSHARAIDYLTPKREDSNRVYLELVDLAIIGDDSFGQKREVIDEYGWRHFGDIYGDHEAVGFKGPGSLASHYNNQYDPVAGFARQFLRSGDLRWWYQMDELARHVVDIDIYHTTKDKSAYNNGLFWHTCHYVDAGTSTHRTYPRGAGVSGGGPSGGHLYATGLVLHHLLTGDVRSREAAINLARWVIDADDGRKSVFRLLDGGETGHPTASARPTDHGPGRGSGNSLNTLLDGYRLSGDRTLLEKAERVIARCIHPKDDIEARDLLDAETKWFYTMFLQALGRYLDDMEVSGRTGSTFHYARESLLRYARWMADHEYPYLEKPERLEYPTETWAAQDMRKSDVFKFAAKHAEGAERISFLERSEFFFRASTEMLAASPTRSLARPVVLMLSNGLMHSYFQANPNHRSLVPRRHGIDFGSPAEFVPQKVRVIRRLKALAIAGFLLPLIALAAYLLKP